MPYMNHLQALYASIGVPTHMDTEYFTLTPFNDFDAPSGLLGIKVFSVEQEGHQMETFDISVPGAKEFVAGPGLLVHNTAEIVFGDPDNDEYINLKNWSLNPHRGAYGWTSNNSVFAQQGMDYTKVAAITAANGEPGYAWLDNMKNFGRMNGTENHNDWRAEGEIRVCRSGPRSIQTRGCSVCQTCWGSHSRQMSMANCMTVTTGFSRRVERRCSR